MRPGPACLGNRIVVLMSGSWPMADPPEREPTLSASGTRSDAARVRSL